MTVQLLAPLAVAVAAAFSLTGLHRHVRPDLAARALTVAMFGAFVATSQVLAALALGSVSHLPGLHGAVEWCRHALGVHASVGPFVGATSVVVLVVAAFRTHRVLRSWWSVRRAEPGAPEVVDSDELFAFSLPGPAGRVALSTALVAELDRDEFETVMAHERVHADHRHDRHLLIADLAVAVLPFVAPLRRRLRFALERWADEVAVTRLGGDRGRVARTVARVAVAHADGAASVAAFSGHGVAARVEALLRPPEPRFQTWYSFGAVAVVVTIAMATGMQAHHMAAWLITLCPT